MFKFDMRDIISASQSLNVFRRGFDYYKEHRVIKFAYNPEVNRIIAKVEGTELYHVDIYIKDGMFSRAYCDCPAFHEYPKYCKHIAATLLHAKLHEASQAQHSTLNELMDYYMDQDFEPIQGNVLLSTGYTLKFDPYALTAAVNVTLGEDQQYVLKDPFEFFAKRSEGKSYTFGKKFTFDPYVHAFDSVDQKVFDFLDDVIESQFHHQERSVETSGFKKDIFLSNRQLLQFLKLLDHEPLHVRIDHDQVIEGQMLIHFGELPLHFAIEESEEDFVLNIESLKALMPLSRDKRVVYYQDEIHVLPDRQVKELAPLIEHVDDGFFKVHIEKHQLDVFMSYLYPIIKRTSQVEISDAIEDKIELRKCDPKLYLDMDDGRVVADLKYCYGSHVFDAFKGLETPDSSKIVLRELKLENKVMHLLESSAFKVSTSGYYIDDEYDIYKFLDEGLQRLQKDVTIYYSDAFSKLEVKDYDRVMITSTLDESMAYFNFKFAIDHIDMSEIPEILKDLREKKTYHRLKDGSFISLDHEHFHQFNGILDDLDLKPEDFEEGMIQLPSYLSLYVNDKLQDLDTRFQRNESFKQLIDNIQAPESVIFDVPEIVADKMRSYQVTGYNWLKTLARYKFGGILADDMGLGKTLQTLCYITSELENEQINQILIVAPTSLTYNWLNEIKKFFPHLKALIVDGNKNQREEKLSTAEDYDLIITSYAMVRNDLALYQQLKLDVCIIDEAQHIKNPGAKTSKAIKKLHANYRFALTGTPIENSLMELWSIFDFIMPQYLGKMSQFKIKYEKPIKEQDQVASDHLTKMISPFILRRLKQEVLKELPDKIENKMIVELNDEQKKIYIGYLDQVKGELSEAYQREGYQKSQMKTLAALTRLRQICLHPGLFLENYDGPSAKMNLLKELLEELVSGGHKILLFSQFTSMLARIKTLLESMHLDYYTIDGSTPSLKRNEMVDDFNNDEVPVFLVSLKAGGTGLNLTGADTVIHFDPWWNPAVEDQATDRAYRIGQTKKVHVIKLVTQGTIEEKIYALQEKKKALINKVIQPGETLITKLSEEEIRDLFI